MQIFACHAVGGIVGNLLTAIFAQASVSRFDGFTDISGGCGGELFCMQN
jgi:Amt family ammonium transporter